MCSGKCRMPTRCCTWLIARFLAKSFEALQGAMRAWAELYATTRMRENVDKQQLLPRSIDAMAYMNRLQIPNKSTAKILGVCMGMVPRKAAVDEVKRASQVVRLAKRVALLPASNCDYGTFD